MRLRLTIAYAGTAYSGWQVQPGPPTVQKALEDAVARIGGHRVRVTGASRTDAGVHATGQVCHFDAPRELPSGEWLCALNAVLPADIRILGAERADDDFDARHGARRKRYVYRIDTAPVASPFLAPWTWHRSDLGSEEGIALMARGAAALLVDDLDQRRFASQPEETRPIRPLEGCEVSAPATPDSPAADVATATTPAGSAARVRPSRPAGRATATGEPLGVPPAPPPFPATGPPSVIVVTVVGRSFLRHAVRGMVGSLVELALGQRSWEDFEALIEGTAGHRPLSSKAPARGLCLERIDY